MAHLSISTVREGTDPPATDVVPDANLTTLGPLGWYRQSESGLAVTNSKSGGSHNGSVSDIGSPAWFYYAGSNNKQASLAPYTDGVSPVSSAGTRAYRIATANGTGARITIPLAGQSVKVLLFHGGYASTSRVAASLSDASAAAVQSDFVTGAATVGWWRTTILAHAAGTANLVIDLTSITGANAQFLGYAVDYGTPVIASITPAYPGGQPVAVIAGFPSVPTDAASTYDGVAIDIDAAATLLSVPINWPAQSAFLFGGAHATVEFDVNKTLVLGNGTVSASLAVPTTVENPSYMDARSADALANPLDTYNGGLSVAFGDTIRMWFDPDESAVPYPATNQFTPLEPELIAYSAFWDADAGTWSGMTTTYFPEPVAPPTGTLEVICTELTLAPPGTLVAGSYNLHSYGDLDWLKTARLAADTYDSKSGAAIIATPAAIGSPVWNRLTSADASTNPLLSWSEGGDPLASYAGDRYLQYSDVAGAGVRFVVSPGGDLVKIYLFISNYQSTGRLAVSLSDESAADVTEDLIAPSGVARSYLVEITAHPDDIGATVQIDWTLVTGSNITWQAIAVGTGSPGSAYTLAADDTTIKPGQTVRLTLSGGPFLEEVSAAEMVYGAVAVPVSYTIISPSIVDVVVPAMAEFVAGGANEDIPFYASFTFRLTAGAESADTPNTNQLVPLEYGLGFATTFKARVLDAAIAAAIVRSSDDTDIGLDGTLSTVTSNVPAYDGDDGVILGAGGTNLVVRSNDLATGSTKRGTATATYVATGGPRDDYTQIRGISSGNVNDVFETVAGFGANSQIAASLFIRRVTTTGTIRFTNPQDGFLGDWSIDLSLLPDGWERVTAFHPAVTVLYEFSATSGGSAGWHIRRIGSDVIADCDVSEVNLVSGTRVVSSPIKTTGSAVLRQPAYISSTLSALGVASQVNEYTVAVVARFPVANGVAPGDYGVIASLGRSTDRQNEVSIVWNGLTGEVYLDKFYGGSSVGTTSTGATWAADQPVILAFSMSATDGLILRVNNTVVVSGSTAAKAPFTLAADSIIFSGLLGLSTFSRLKSLAGILVADRAYSQAELEALDVDDFVAIGNYELLGSPPWGAYAHPSAQEGDPVYIERVQGYPVNTPATATIQGVPPASANVYTYSITTSKWLSVVRATLFAAGSMPALTNNQFGRGRTRLRGR